MTTQQRVKEMIRLSRGILKRQLMFQEHKDAIRKEEVGRHGQVLVYRVSHSTVQTHERRGYRAVRVNIRKG